MSHARGGRRYQSTAVRSMGLARVVPLSLDEETSRTKVRAKGLTLEVPLSERCTPTDNDGSTA